jgi:predicted nucleic acid-binding protein
MGEIYRILETDPKLKRVDPVYFSEFMTDIRVWLNHVPMKNLEHNQSVLNLVGNDWYIIAVAKSISANYIITFDKYLISQKTTLKEEHDILVVTPEEFEKDYKQSGLHKLGEGFFV